MRNAISAQVISEGKIIQKHNESHKTLAQYDRRYLGKIQLKQIYG